MEVVILESAESVALEGAACIRRLLSRKPRAVLGLATGNTPRAMYRRLVEDRAAGRLSFAEVTSFNLDEYLGLAEGDVHSFRHYMQRELFDHVDIDPANTHLPSCAPGENPRLVCQRYEDAIRAAGGIDLQVLGIGGNGHVGFNEPTSSLSSRTRVKTLTRETLAANRKDFDDPRRQPQLAITMGIGTILEAAEVLLLATGTAKAKALREMIEGSLSAMWPATALQLHQCVTALIDEEAASQLENREYYDWVRHQRQSLQTQLGSE